MKIRVVLSAIVVVILAVVATIPVLPRANAAAPVITAADTVAVPRMVSLFGDQGPGGSFDSPLGPSWTTFVVKTTGGTPTSVRLNLETLLLSILPSTISSDILSAQTTAWTTWRNTLAAKDMTFDATLGAWKYSFSLNDYFSVLGSFLSSGRMLELVAEDLRLGDLTVPVTATNADGSATGSISLTIVDAQVPLRVGWNLVSTPMALSNNTWGTIRALGDGLSYDAAVRYDATNKVWVTIADTYVVQPLEAVYIHATANDQLGAIMSRTTTAPAVRSLVAGWNLVGMAPDLLAYFSLTFGQSRGLAPVNVALTSVAQAPGNASGYTTVLSPGHSVSYTQSYSYGTTSLGTSYPWSVGQPAWAYVQAQVSSIPATPDPVTAGYFGWTVPFGGYWVFMDNADVLAGFSFTPVSKDWLLKARKQVLGF